jgi:hypothetical protein
MDGEKHDVLLMFDGRWNGRRASRIAARLSAASFADFRRRPSLYMETPHQDRPARFGSMPPAHEARPPPTLRPLARKVPGRKGFDSGQRTG